MIQIQAEDINKLRILYIVHFILYAIIIIFNFILIKEIIWLQKTLKFLYLIANYFLIVLYVIPIIELFVAISNKLNKNRTILFKTLNLAFCLIAILMGLFFSVLLIINTMDFSDFNRECPFNIPITILNDNKCNNKICILNNENLEKEYPYEYLCNYNPIKNFKDQNGPFKRKINETEEITTDVLIICEKYEFIGYYFENEIIYSYLDYCNNLNEIYICQRFLEPKKYKLDENYKCPNDKYITKVYYFCIINIIINLIMSFIPWKLEINAFAKIISQFRRNNLSNSKNSTKDCSKINDNLEENFKKAPTELIIVYNNTNSNFNLNTDKNTENQKEDNKNENMKEIIENYQNIKYILDKKINRRNDNKLRKISEQITNNITNLQGSSDIFIIEDNKAIQKIKRK